MNKKSISLKVFIVLLVAFTLFGVLGERSELSGISYQDTIMGKNEIAQPAFVLWLRLMLVALPASAILIWFKNRFFSLLAALCSGTVGSMELIRALKWGAEHGRNPFEGIEASENMLIFLPLVIALLCVVLFLKTQVAIKRAKLEVPSAEA